MKDEFSSTAARHRTPRTYGHPHPHTNPNPHQCWCVHLGTPRPCSTPHTGQLQPTQLAWPVTHRLTVAIGRRKHGKKTCLHFVTQMRCVPFTCSLSTDTPPTYTPPPTVQSYDLPCAGGVTHTATSLTGRGLHCTTVQRRPHA